jgi:hypothetical protein
VAPQTTEVAGTAAVPPAGMVLTYSVSLAEDGRWQAIVCAANFGSFTATDVAILSFWTEEYHPLVLRTRHGAVDLKFNRASVEFGDMPAGARVQVALLLEQSISKISGPTVLNQLTYRDGPPRVDLPLQCEPEEPWGDVPPNPGPYSQWVVISQETPEALQEAGAVAPQSQSGDAAQPLAQPDEQLREQISNPSWLCFVIPFILLVVAIIILIYRIRAKARVT